MNNEILAIMKLAIETGQPVTRSYNIGGKRCQETTSEVIDIEPVSTSWSPAQSPYARGSRFVSGNYRHAAPALGHSDLVNSVGRHTNTVSSGIAKEVQSALAKIDGSGLPTDMCSPDKASIFRALIEFEFSILSEGEKIEVVRMLGYDVTNTWPRSGNWNVVNGQKFESIIKLACMLIIRGRNEAAVVIGNLLGLKPEYCFRTFPQKDDMPSALPFRNPQVEDLIPKQLVVLDRAYELTFVHYVRDFRGIKESAVCVYVDSANPQKSFSLPATRVEKDGKLTLRIGTVPVPARLFARDQMAQVEGATVLFCQDTRIAMELSRIADEARLLENHGIIISGCYGGAPAFPVLKFNDFAGQNVVLLLESTREALIDAPKWAERCEKDGVTSVKIFPWLVFAGEGLAGEDQDCVESLGQDQWKDMLLENAVRLEDVELPSKFARSVCEKSLSRSDYAKWLISAGLVTSANTHVDNDLGDEDDIQFICLGDIPDEEAELSQVITLESVVNSESSALLWAPSDAGKSFGSLEIGIGLATGTAAFGIPARCSHVVGIMDGEIPVRKKKKYVRQLLQSRPELISLAVRNLHVLPSPGKLKRFDEDYADILLPKLKKLGIEFLFLDNLQALDPKAGKFNAEKLFAFVRKMKRAGIAIFIIHHADKDGTSYKGPTDLVDLSQTVIRGEGVDEVRKIMRNDPENTDILDACDEGGPVLRLTITKCKVGGMKGKSVIYHLPIGGVWTHLEGDLVPTIEPLPANVRAESDDKSAIPAPEDMSIMYDMTPDEEKVYASLKGKKYTRVELEAVTGFKTDKIGRILRKLVELNLVKQEGAGKATYYRCV